LTEGWPPSTRVCVHTRHIITRPCLSVSTLTTHDGVDIISLLFHYTRSLLIGFPTNLIPFKLDSIRASQFQMNSTIFFKIIFPPQFICFPFLLEQRSIHAIQLNTIDHLFKKHFPAKVFSINGAAF
jgi:hypothetical protein